MRKAETYNMHTTVSVTVMVTRQSLVTGSWYGFVTVDGVSHGHWERHLDGHVALFGGPPRRSKRTTAAIRAAITTHMSSD